MPSAVLLALLQKQKGPLPKANHLGSHLRQARVSKKLSLRELSRRAKVGIATLSRTESGITMPTFAVGLRILAALGLDASVLSTPTRKTTKRRTARK